MSNFCCFNLKENHLQFKSLNNLAKELIGFALDNNLAIFFNSFDYGEDIIKDGKMKDFFLMSDSFVYKNCEFLDNGEFVYLNDLSFRKAFFKKYKFFEEIINCIFKYDVSVIEIYITEDGSVNSVSEFDCIESKANNFLENLYKSVIDAKEEWAYEFPTAKFNITR